METISERIRRLRKKCRKTQNEVADFLDMNRSTYARHEANGDFTLEDGLRLEKCLGVTITEILTGEPTHTILETPNNPFEDKENLILTNKEKNIIKIIRNLKTADKQFLLSFLEERQ